MPQQTFNPFWTERTFGVEMEMLQRRRYPNGRTGSLAGADINSALSIACRMPVYGNGGSYASRHAGTAWEVKYDTSAGWEVVTPALRMREDGHCDELRRGCEAITALRPVLDQRCGVHVHVDCSDFSWEDLQRLIAMWMRYEPFFFEMLPSSRHGNRYCLPLRGTSWETAARSDEDTRRDANLAIAATNERDFSARARAMGKYRSLNVSGWWYHGRVEFRLHSASTTYEKLRKWVVLLTTLIGRVKSQGERTPRLNTAVLQPRARSGFSTKYVLRMIGLGPTRWNIETELYGEVFEFVEERRAKFGHANTRRRATAGAPDENGED